MHAHNQHSHIPHAHIKAVATVDPASLPSSLRELVEALGVEDALKLVGMHGGARITVPKVARPDHELRLVLGEAGFAALVQRYGGEALDLPKGDAYLRELRHDQVRRYREAGYTMDEIAEATGYTRRHVINIVGGHADSGADVYTRDMFGEPDNSPKQPAWGAHNPFGMLSGTSDSV